MTDLAIALHCFEKMATGIVRPEGVVVAVDDTVVCADLGRGCIKLTAAGAIGDHVATGGAANGLAIDGEGRVIVANFGTFIGRPGPLQRVDLVRGTVETLVAEIGGRTLTACNFPVVDRFGSIWCTHSTWATPWTDALDGRADGFVFRWDRDGSVHVVAEGLRFANGCALDADEAFFYVCQTTGLDVVRMPVLPDRSLGPLERYGPVLGIAAPGPTSMANVHRLPAEVRGALGYPDGCNFDAKGNLWVTLPMADRVVAISPDGEMFTVAHDPTGQLLSHPTNVSWGGADLCDVYVGSLVAGHVLHARSPVPGAALQHQRLSSKT